MCFPADKKTMKTLVILFADYKSLHIFDKAFGSASAFERSLLWAKKVCELSESGKDSEIAVFAFDKNFQECKKEISALNVNAEVFSRENWYVSELFEFFAELSRRKSADSILFAWADCPFLNIDVTKNIISTHKNCRAEYTFADGYSDGLCPEILDSGAAAILAELCKKNEIQENRKEISRTSIFDSIKKDINSFEVETVIADEDESLLRIHFNCGTKGDFLSCKAMFDCGVDGKNADQISKEASENPKVLKTVPAYYQIQITDKVSSKVIYHPEEMDSLDGKSFMPLEDFKNIAQKISDFSETAVVSLSAWGEAVLHPDFVEFVKTVLLKPGLTVLIEGDCSEISEETCAALKNICDSVPPCADGGQNNPKIIWLVTLDAFTEEVYCKIHSAKNGNFEKSKAAILLLEKYFSGNVYAQFTRMNENESELEQFFRFWNEKTSPTKGNFTIQKYDNCFGALPDRKPADLAPVERNVCWHLRRDMTILLDGSVPYARGKLKSDILGNAFSENLEDIWKKTDSEVQKQINHDYSGKCENCDEYYIFNF